MLYYWTRKPLIVGRAVALASTLNDINDVKNLLGLGRESRSYKYPPDVGVYKEKLGMERQRSSCSTHLGVQGI